MLRYQTALSSLLAALLVPALAGQGELATLQDALSGTTRALEVVKGLEKKLSEDPSGALALVLSATEAPGGDDAQRDRRLEALRGEVNLLQMELDALQSPLTSPDGAVQSALGTREPLDSAQDLRPATSAGVSTGLDDSMRALLGGAPAAREKPRGEGSAERGAPRDKAAEHAGAAAPAAPADDSAYSADPLRHGITCYRAGRFAEAYQLLRPLEDATALYWQARTLERLERLDEAVEVMERALAKGGDGFEQRRAQTDLEFLKWKRDFVKSLPGSAAPKKKEGP